MAITTPATLEVGERVRIELDLPDFSDILVLSGEICWNANGRAGLRFIGVPAQIAQRLQFWISERMSELVPAW
jgi:Tfp pilus assembly protein PilZ